MAAETKKSDGKKSEVKIAAAADESEEATAVGAEMAEDDTSALLAGPQMPDFKGMSYRQVLDVMQARGLNISLRGHGRVVEQSPPAGEPVRYGAPIWVRLESPGQTSAVARGVPRG